MDCTCRELLENVGGGQHTLLNAFTVDVEDYFQVTAFEKHIRREQWDEFESRVVPNTRRILQLLDRHRVKATFFVLGWVAHRHPHLVREIHACGHEIGSHSYWHRLIYRLSPEQFRDDLRQSRHALEDAIGQGISAFRAPSFSITRHSHWAWEILVEEGFAVDSSVFPTYHPTYGIPDAERGVHQIKTAAGFLWEFPLAVIRLARVNVPVSGGGYFRAYPARLTARLLSSLNRKHRRPFVFYVHPWELDPDQPRMRAGSRLAKARHYLNLASTEGKLRLILERFSFAPLGEVIKQVETEKKEHVTAPLPVPVMTCNRVHTAHTRS
jgi:polysaccharide deacetylase family protein (PEP-CTERM system associated)